MVVLSIEAYSNLIDGVEEALDLADAAAAENDARLSHDEVFGKLRAMVNG